MGTLVFYRPRDLRGRVLRFLRARATISTGERVAYTAFGLSLYMNEDLRAGGPGKWRPGLYHGNVRSVLQQLYREGLLDRSREGKGPYCYRVVTPPDGRA